MGKRGSKLAPEHIEELVTTTHCKELYICIEICLQILINVTMSMIIIIRVIFIYQYHSLTQRGIAMV